MNAPESTVAAQRTKIEMPDSACADDRKRELTATAILPRLGYLPTLSCSAAPNDFHNPAVLGI